MYDLHAHILPALDDGARTAQEALAMASVAARSGTTLMVATPHMKDVNELSSPGNAIELRSHLDSMLGDSKIPLGLVMGMENHVVPGLDEMFADGRALPIGSTRYALIEMPFFGHPEYLESTLSRVQSLGITPVLAHPERIEVVQRRPEILVDFVEAGMLSQITAGSLLGHFGAEVRRFTEELVRSGLAHVMASDCHRPDGPRAPALGPGLAAAAELIGEKEAERLVNEIPRSIVEDRKVIVGKPRPVEPMRAEVR